MEAADLTGKIRSLILYILNLRYLLKKQMLISIGFWLSGIQEEVWTVSTNLHVIKIYKVSKVMELDEISKEVEVNRDAL